MRMRHILLLLAAAFILVACGEAVTPTVNSATSQTNTNATNVAALPNATTGGAVATATITAPEATNTLTAPGATSTMAMPGATDTMALPTETMVATAAPTMAALDTVTAAPEQARATTPPQETATAAVSEATPSTGATPSAASASADPSPIASGGTAGPMVEQTLIVPDALKTGLFADTQTLTLPQGFNISLFANGLSAPRLIAVGPDGNIWVTERGAGRVLVYKPQGDAAAPAAPTVFASGLSSPHGIAFNNGYVYVAETSRVLRIKNDNGKASGDPDVIIPNIPYAGDHSTRTLQFTPDGKLLVSIGSSCNVCAEPDERFASVMIYNADGSNGRLYATGLRNAVGLALNPVTNQVWFTNNGRDELGDDIPKEMIGTLQDGAFYGWPDCYGNQVYDKNFAGDASKCPNTRVPELQVQAHSAPLGLTFVPESGWSAPYAGNMIIAYHGSWNRSVPTGYKVVRVPMRNGQVAGDATDFISGWIKNGDVWGRPVAMAIAPDGAMYLTDDKTGAIYRVYQTGQ